MRGDLHVREYYNQPLDVYHKLKRLGMDLVTVTDRDSIDAAEALRSRPDFFLSEEATCRLPSGNQLLESLAAWLRERNLFYSANHVFSSLTASRSLADFALFERAFPALEARNGHMLARANENAAALADFTAKAEVGGSDAHVIASVGCAWTVVPRARTRQEYLAGLRRGLGKVRDSGGGYWKLTRDIVTIGGLMVRHRPLTLPLAPLALGVPLFTLGNYAVESLFARWWMARYLRTRAAPCVSGAAAEVAA
jgi:predicted metal-dependent phosphoesterase TrpH